MAVQPIPAHQFADLVQAAAAVAGQTDLTAVLFKTVETGMALTGATYGALGVLGEHGVLVEFLHAGMDRSTVARIGSPPMGRGLLGTIARDQRTVRIDQITEHADSVGFPAHHPPMSSFLGVPISVGGRVFGNIYLTEKDDGFTPDDESVVEALAVVAGAAISTARLQRRLRRVAIIEDRERIARDLHDAIIQDLFAVGLTIQAQLRLVGDSDVANALEGTVKRLDDAISELRRFIFDLRPPVWAGRNLAREVTEVVETLAEAHHADVVTSFEGPIESVPTGVVEDAVQAVKESLSNALRHAGPERIEVGVRVEPDCLVVIVTDDGSGFEPGAVTYGMGIENLRTRAANAGGEATISSRPGKGTTVKVVFPI